MFGVGLRIISVHVSHGIGYLLKGCDSIHSVAGSRPAVYVSQTGSINLSGISDGVS